jgi:hypothetical protein
MSWLDADEIERLRELYSKTNTPIPKGPPQQVWRQLQKAFHKRCVDGRAQCIVGELMGKADAPADWKQNRYEWLSDQDIGKVERNFMKTFARYYFVGAVSIDFDLKDGLNECVVDNLCAIKLDQLAKKGYEQIGIIFNTAPHDKPGQHWVAVFCDIRPELVYPRMTYYDSYSHQPEPEIKRLMNRWKQQWDGFGKHSQPMKLTYNSTRSQYGNSECGMFCLYFHHCCLTETPMNKRIPDEVVNSFRSLFFSNV